MTPFNGSLKMIIGFIGIGGASALIAWGTASNSLDSVKTEVKINTEWKMDHSVKQAKFEGTVDTKLETMLLLLQELKKDQKDFIKEVRDEFKTKQDRVKSKPSGGPQ